eukprot:SAG11_NODE_34030_length_274_cov_0.588571_1_plen_32_part_10
MRLFTASKPVYLGAMATPASIIALTEGTVEVR